MNRLPQPEPTPMRAPGGHPSGDPVRAVSAVVVPFPASAASLHRRTPPAGDARGEILLFLGVRYERIAS